jgi:23S rRNA pseudouridine2605 synthase
MVEHRNAGKASGPGGQDSARGERVAKALARSGVASRREIERLIAEGRVALNGRVLDTPAVKVEPGDLLTVDGKVVEAAEATRVWRYHKPAGLLTTHSDPKGRPTVFENLPQGMPRVISVGRLDINSEGLLLLTNDGELARALELPSSGWVRRYRARARGRVTQAQLDGLKEGVTVEGVNYGPIEAKLDKAKEGPQGANLWITVGITEGKNREVRRVLQHLGLEVNRLIRLAYGPFSLGTLGVGEVEEVGPRVIREQLAGHVAPENMPTGSRVEPLPGAAKKPRRAASDVAVEKRALPRPSAPRSKPRGSAAPFAAREASGGFGDRTQAPRKTGAKRPAAKGGPREARTDKPARGFGEGPERAERSAAPRAPRAPREASGRPERAPREPRAGYGAGGEAAKPARSFGTRPERPERADRAPRKAGPPAKAAGGGYGARKAAAPEGGYGERPAAAPRPRGFGAPRAEAAESKGGFGARERLALARAGGYGAREQAEPKRGGGFGERAPAARAPRREPRPDRPDKPERAERKPGWAKAKPKGPPKGRGPAKPGGRPPPRKPR